MTFSPDLLPLLFIALGAGGLGKMARIPGGALLSATIIIAFVVNWWGFSHSPPLELIMIMQVMTGSMLGQSINRRFWQDILQIWRPTLMVVGLFTLISVPFAALLALVFGFDPVTAILAATPARMQDMIVLASSMDSDAITVMVMQFARQMSIIVMTPFMLAAFLKAEKAKKKAADGGNKHAGSKFFTIATLRNHAFLLIPGIAGAIVGHSTGHILGALLGAFATVAFTRVVWIRAGEIPLPRTFGFLIQCLGGVLIGTRITPEIGNLLLARMVPLLGACFYVLGGGLIIMHILVRKYNWHKGLAWMSAAPGRVGDMLAMSQDINLSGHDRLALASVHTVRQVYFTLIISAVMALF